MPPSVALAAAAAAAYLAGSIPFGLLLGKAVYGVDVRERGSGNIGATNVARTLGKTAGAACFAFDFLKGLLPTLLLPRLLPIPDDWRPAAEVACGTAALVGHVFPVWLGFRGGKGVATGAGVAAVLCWPAALAAAAVFAAVFAVKRVVALGSIAASVAYAAVTLAWLGDPFDRRNLLTAACAVALPALIVLRHRDNIRRLLRGEERRFGREPHEPAGKP